MTQSIRSSFAIIAAAIALLLTGAGAAQVRDPYTAPIAAPAGVAQHVKVAQGMLKGVTADGVGWFLGIPYAAPPLGELRWRPPGAPPTWRGERDATKAGAPCGDHEDCLFLNVVRPAFAKRGAKLPVMVWIHGGAFFAGTSMGGYGGDTDGHAFARRGVIVVSVNYRLGRAGWFAHPALDREGHPFANYGMMDQIAALKWVRANIADFGGDLHNVTIFGESAGGVGVLYLMLAPDARGLFDKAIAESSFARNKPVPLDQAEAFGVAAAEAAGVRGSDAAAAGALRKLPLADLPLPPRGTPGRPYPVIDGRLIPGTVMAGFEAAREAPVPLVIGGNSNEASLTRPTPALFDAMPSERRAAVLALFDPNHTGDAAQTINDFVTVQGVTEPDRAIVRLHTSHGFPSWTYYFSYVPPTQKDNRPYGAIHTDELRFVFVSPRATFAPEDLSLAQAMNLYWAQFARDGDPGAVGAVRWPRWSDAEGQIEFSANGPQTRYHLLQRWRDFAEQLARQVSR